MNNSGSDFSSFYLFQYRVNTNLLIFDSLNKQIILAIMRTKNFQIFRITSFKLVNYEEHIRTNHE